MEDLTPDNAPIDESAETYFAWAIGDDYDCDTCGMTWNEASLDLDWDEEGTRMFSYLVGCYGGASVLSTDPDFHTRVEEILADLRAYPGWSDENEREVRTLLAR